MVSIGAMVVGCSEILEELGDETKTLEVGEKITIKGLSVELTSPVEVTVNPEGVVVSYGGEIEGELLEEATITIGNDKKITLATGEISFYKNQNLKSGVLAASNEVDVGDVALTLTESVVINVEPSGEFTYGGSVKGTLKAGSIVVISSTELTEDTVVNFDASGVFSRNRTDSRQWHAHSRGF